MKSKIHAAVEAVMDLIDGMNNFAPITRGALGTGNGISCEIAPSVVEAVFMDKGAYIPLTLAINGKHSSLETLSDTLNNICDTLTRLTAYPSGNGWQIVDITYGSLPQIIGRETDNRFLMNCDIVIKINRKDDEINASELGK